jgi:hypothetical protein
VSINAKYNLKDHDELGGSTEMRCKKKHEDSAVRTCESGISRTSKGVALQYTTGDT